MGVSPAAVAAYHDLFFEVRPHLNAHAYVLGVVLGGKPFTVLKPDDREAILKTLGFQLGEAAVDAVLYFFANPPAVPATLNSLDLSELSERDVAAGVFHSRSWHRAFDHIEFGRVPVVAMLHGAVVGGGLELALLCDLIVADKMARFGFPELRLGFIPGFGGIPRLRRDVGNSFIRDLLFTGRTVKAETAHQAGLITHLAGEG